MEDQIQELELAQQFNLDKSIGGEMVADVSQIDWNTSDWELNPEQFGGELDCDIPQIYVDKTQQILNMGNVGKNLCLFRPRRMGKTTTIEMLEAMARASYQQDLVPNHVLPEKLQGTAFAEASDAQKEFLKAPFVMRLDFTANGFASYAADLVEVIQELQPLQQEEESLRQRQMLELSSKKEELILACNEDVAAIEQRTASQTQQLEASNQSTLESLLKDGKILQYNEQVQSFISALNEITLSSAQAISLRQNQLACDLEQLEKYSNPASLEQEQNAELSRLQARHESIRSQLRSKFGDELLQDAAPHSYGFLHKLESWLIGLFTDSLRLALQQDIALSQKLGLSELEQSSQALLSKVKAIADKSTNGATLENVICALLEQMPDNSIVLLIDEYDAVINQVLGHASLWQNCLSLLNGLFLTLKSLNYKFKFVFVTGITCFHSNYFFASINQLKNISWHPLFADIIGFTEQEIKQYYGKAIYHMATCTNSTPKEILARIKHYYEGYSFCTPRLSGNMPVVKVSSPIDIQGFLTQDSLELQKFWCNTGTAPSSFMRSVFNWDIKSVLLEIISKLSKGRLWVKSKLLYLTPVPHHDLTQAEFFQIILLQTGYLTIDCTETSEEKGVALTVPNYELATALIEDLLENIKLENFTWSYNHCSINSHLVLGAMVIDYLFSGDTLGIEHALCEFFNDILSYDSIYGLKESQWRDLLFLTLERDAQLELFADASIQIEREKISAQGRSDIVLTDLKKRRQVVLELKVVKENQPAQDGSPCDMDTPKIQAILSDAIKQVATRNYEDKFDFSTKRYVCILIVCRTNAGIRFRIKCEKCV